MKALSIRSPWWWFILHGGKDIENRGWPTSYRGPVLIHASKWWRTVEVLEVLHTFGPLAEKAGAPKVTMDAIRTHGGCIVGMANLVICTASSDSPWFFGPYGFQLVNPVAFETPIPCKGALGLFTPPAEALHVARVALGHYAPQ